MNKLINIYATKAPVLMMVAVIFLNWNDNSLFAQGSSYKVQPEDRLQITFPRDPELNTEVTIKKNGTIELPVIGSITAAGLSLDELRNRIKSQMAQYNKLITQLGITLTAYGHNRVYVTGQVASPGKYSFEEIPNLWNIILEAGGPLETPQIAAYLEEVAIVRSQEDGQILTVNLEEALRNGGLNELPKILPGDMIHIPGRPVTATSPTSLGNKDEVYILGAVGNSGVHQYDPNLNLLEIISKAGLGVNADLKRVKHLSVSRDTTVAKVNLEKYLSTGRPVPRPVGPGDMIYVPQKKGPPALVGAVTTVVITTVLTALITTAITK